jgi:peptidoglycan lytic transglycosylase
VRGRLWRRLSTAVAVVALASLALSAAPALAVTGGAGVASDGVALPGQGFAFGPMRSAGATWYGPGLYGRQTACGATLTETTIGVAHRTLPCGTAVKFLYEGHVLVTRVIDRGPYTPGNAFDLTNGARLALDFEGAGRVRYAVAVAYARHPVS